MATPNTLDQSIFAGERSPQMIMEGYGPLFYRRYYVDLKRNTKSKRELISYIIENLNEFSPSDLTYFRRIDGQDALMQEGDDYWIHIVGPWQGPVRVIEVSETSFSFVTLDDHLEAGEIQFRAIDHPEDTDSIRFEIRAWSRSRDIIIHFLYDIIPIVKISQRQMWNFFCNQVAESYGEQDSYLVHTITHRVPRHKAEENLSGRLEKWQQYQPKLFDLRSRNINFDLDKSETFTETNGWNIDKYTVELPSEKAGQPEPDQSWMIAKDVLLNYEFPDPNLITGIYIPDDPLEERVMLLEAKFLVFTFHFGVRISGVIDEQKTDADNKKAQVWGYSYQTLEGHFEMGEITFEIWKFLDTGRVEFRIHSYSKTSHISNLFYRFGFAIFGRHLQKYFAQSSLSRMQEIVLNRLSTDQKSAMSEQPDIHRIRE